MTGRRAFSVAIFARHGAAAAGGAGARVLLIEHARLRTWLPVGGEIEAGETPLEAARRELREETGLLGRFELLAGVAGTPPGLIAYEEHQAGSKGLHMNFCFVADVESDHVVGNEEVRAHRWVDSTEGIDCPPNVRELVRVALAAGAPALVALARAWLAAFNARDLEHLLALYADDAVHLSPRLRARRPETGGLVRGKAALRTWWSDSFARLPGLVYSERALSTSVDPAAATTGATAGAASGAAVAARTGRVLLEYDRTLPGEETQSVAESFVVRDGLIVESRVYLG